MTHWVRLMPWLRWRRYRLTLRAKPNRMAAVWTGGSAMSPSEPGDNRRNEHRHLACMLAQIAQGDRDPRNALIRDISTTGALLLTRAKLQVGDPIHLSLYLSTDEGSQPVTASGRIVRFEQRPRALADVWTHSAAVHFDTPLAQLAPGLEAIAARQRAVFGTD